jgi:hypothetical protein
MRLYFVCCVCLFSMVSCSLRASVQSKPVWHEAFGVLESRTDTEHWPTPEALVKDLRSSDPQTRLEGLRLLGLEDSQTHRKIWAQTSPTRVIGEDVITPDKVQLTYAALGNDSTQQAILAVQSMQMTYAAVAVPTNHGWKRIAVFSCWCKYEMTAGEDTLDDFVQLTLAPSGAEEMPWRFELVLSASGGGTGIYEKDEAHYRMINGQLRQVMAFISAKRSCPMADPCDLTKRWFTSTGAKGHAAGILVEARGRFPQNLNGSRPASEVRELEDRHLQSTSCQVYNWNEKAFRYTPAGPFQPCSKIPYH